MPPKKKKSAKKKDVDKELQPEEKYNLDMAEIKAMKDCLANRHSMWIQAKTTSEVLGQNLEEVQKELQTQKSDYQSVIAAMTCQYKTMEAKKDARIHMLEKELADFKFNLEKTEKLLTKQREEKKSMLRDKNNEIETLKQKINSLESSYEAILHVYLAELGNVSAKLGNPNNPNSQSSSKKFRNKALDELKNLINTGTEKWNDQSRMIQAKNMQTLSQFGLNPLDL